MLGIVDTRDLQMGKRLFALTSGFILLSAGLIKLFSAWGDGKILSYVDPLIRITFKHELFVVGTIEISVAAYVLLSRNENLKMWVLLWLAVNILEYRVANDLLRIKTCPCLGTVGGLLPISKSQIDGLLRIVTLYLLSGAIFFILSKMYATRGTFHLTDK